MIQIIAKLGDALLSRAVPHMHVEASNAVPNGCAWYPCGACGVRRCCFPSGGCGTCLIPPNC